MVIRECLVVGGVLSYIACQPPNHILSFVFASLISSNFFLYTLSFKSAVCQPTLLSLSRQTWVPSGQLLLDGTFGDTQWHTTRCGQIIVPRSMATVLATMKKNAQHCPSSLITVISLICFSTSIALRGPIACLIAVLYELDNDSHKFTSHQSIDVTQRRNMLKWKSNAHSISF